MQRKPMISGRNGAGKSNSLMASYSMRLGEAVLRSRMRDAEQQARLETDVARRVKSEFISNMSHELRTPLNTVIGFSKMLAEQDRRKLAPKEIQEYAKLIQDAAGHLLSLINDILDISKLQSGRLSIDAQEIDIDDIVEAVIASMSRSAVDADVKIQHRMASILPVTIGDQSKIGQVFNNLLSNAIKFTPKGGCISIDVVAHDDEGTEIVMRDTGIGMEAAEVEIALVPFGQVDGGKARWREGAGLGLPIAKALVELHGGSIKIKSAKGIGTEVTVFLPSKQTLATLDQQSLAIGLGSASRPLY